jgi:hypothetical protein
LTVVEQRTVAPLYTLIVSVAVVPVPVIVGVLSLVYVFVIGDVIVGAFVAGIENVQFVSFPLLIHPSLAV